MKYTERKFLIEGMSCNMCVKHITDSMREVEGIKGIQVSLAQKSAIIKYDESKVSENDIRKIIGNAGYSVVKSEIK